MTPAETFPVGDHLAAELAARAWSPELLAARSGLAPERVAAVLAGADLTAGEAECLAAALGVSPALFLNLQAGHHARLAEAAP